MYSHFVLVQCPLVSHFVICPHITKLGLHPLIPPLFAVGAAKEVCINAVLQFNHRDNEEPKMIGIYYAILAVVSIPVYVLALILKEKGKRAGEVICYMFLFFIALLFI